MRLGLGLGLEATGLDAPVRGRVGVRVGVRARSPEPRCTCSATEPIGQILYVPTARTYRSSRPRAAMHPMHPRTPTAHPQHPRTSAAQSAVPQPSRGPAGTLWPCGPVALWPCGLAPPSLLALCIGGGASDRCVRIQADTGGWRGVESHGEGRSRREGWSHTGRGEVTRGGAAAPEHLPCEAGLAHLGAVRQT